MTKLPKKHQFIDLSDYGRPIATWISRSIVNTKITPIHITIAFVICGFGAIICILKEWFWAAALLLILKSILDAADGALARLRNRPSYVGRYFDSISDIILNFFILFAVYKLTEASFAAMILAFIGMQLQGTLYNYYYVILRIRNGGDTTSRIFETNTPVALSGESQKYVNVFFRLYKLLYGPFDYIIYNLDKKAPQNNYFPKWFLTLVSIFGLGFQLLIISIMLVLKLSHLIIPFFIAYSSFIIIFIGIRVWLNNNLKPISSSSFIKNFEKE